MVRCLVLLLLVGHAAALHGQSPASPPPVDATPTPTQPNADQTPRWTAGGTLALSHGLMQPHGRGSSPAMPDQGMIAELAAYASVKAHDGLSGRLRGCYGCHGLEVEEAVVRFEVCKDVSLRGGRFNVPFGAASQRNDQSIMETISKPLPYIMGNMVRQTEFNHGVIPAPFVDNGINLHVRTQLNDGVLADIDVYMIRGLKGVSPDIGYIASRDFEDNNGEPALGARGNLNLTRESGSFNVGASMLAGHYDEERQRSYLMLGLDAAASVYLPQLSGPLNIRAEVVQRTTDFEDSGRTESSFHKRGWWVQVDAPASNNLQVVASFDGLNIKGIRLGPFGPTTSAALATTDATSTILRLTAGVVAAPMPDLRIKGCVELWGLSDFKDAVVFQGALSWSF